MLITLIHAFASLPDPHHQYPALRAFPGGELILEAWAHRRTALSAYRATLIHAGHADPTAIGADLLHLHHVRMAGISPEHEARCLHLARAAALSWTTRAGRAA